MLYRSVEVKLITTAILYIELFLNVCITKGLRMIMNDAVTYPHTIFILYAWPCISVLIKLQKLERIRIEQVPPRFVHHIRNVLDCSVHVEYHILTPLNISKSFEYNWSCISRLLNQSQLYFHDLFAVFLSRGRYMLQESGVVFDVDSTKLIWVCRKTNIYTVYILIYAYFSVFRCAYMCVSAEVCRQSSIICRLLLHIMVYN